MSVKHGRSHACLAMQPLPRGSVPLDGALLLSFFLYSCVLISACVLVSNKLHSLLHCSLTALSCPHPYVGVIPLHVRLFAVQEPLALRIIIAASAAATLLYTPLLKRVTLVKNAAVAAVIALAPVSGALAAGAVELSAALLLCLLP